MLQLLGFEIPSNVPSHFSPTMSGFDRLKHQGRGQLKLHRGATLSSCLQLGPLSSQGLEFGLEELERAKPAGQKLQVPAGLVQSEQSQSEVAITMCSHCPLWRSQAAGGTACSPRSAG